MEEVRDRTPRRWTLRCQKALRELAATLHRRDAALIQVKRCDPASSYADALESAGALGMQTFDDFLAIARKQPQPQRLLLVFARAEPAPDASPAQRAAFERKEAGALAPAVCVDRTPEEVGTFAALLREAAQAVEHWDILFVAAMDGRGGHAPNSDEAVQPLRMMVEQIKGGRIGALLAVDRNGDLVSLRRA